MAAGTLILSRGETSLGTLTCVCVCREQAVVSWRWHGECHGENLAPVLFFGTLELVPR